MTALAERHVASFLLRFWLEPGGAEDRLSSMHGCIWHLQTDAECYVSEPQMLVEYMLGQLHAQQTWRMPPDTDESRE